MANDNTDKLLNPPPEPDEANRAPSYKFTYKHLPKFDPVHYRAGASCTCESRRVSAQDFTKFYNHMYPQSTNDSFCTHAQNYRTRNIIEWNLSEIEDEF
jgi:hypothetical protein